MMRKTWWAMLTMIALVLPMLIVPTSRSESVKKKVSLQQESNKRARQKDAAAKQLKRVDLTPTRRRTKAELERLALKAEKEDEKSERTEKGGLREEGASLSKAIQDRSKHLSFMGALAAGVAPKVSSLDDWQGKTIDLNKVSRGIGPKVGRSEDGALAKVDINKLTPRGRRVLQSLSPSVIGSADIVVNGPDDFGVGPTDFFFQSETSIDSNPAGTVLVAGYNDLRAAFFAIDQSYSGVVRSTDGGTTWDEVSTGYPLDGILPTTSAGSVFGDPDVKWSPTVNGGMGGFVYSSIYVRNSDGLQGMCINISNPDGSVWGNPIEVTPTFRGNSPGPMDDDAADKEFIDVNLNTGRILMSWTNFPGLSPEKRILMESAERGEKEKIAAAAAGVTPIQILSTYSDNGGTTWSTAVVVGETTGDPNGGVQSSIPRFIPGMTDATSKVYIAYREVFGDDTRNVAVNYSTDGGATFLANGVDMDVAYGPEDQIPGVDRVNNSPALDVDYDTGRVYVAYQRNNPWQNQPYGPMNPAYLVGDIAMRTFIGAPTLPTLGANAPFLIDSDPGKDYAQQYPNVAVDQSTSRVWVNFLDQHASEDGLPSGDLFESMTTYSDDQGVTWSAPTAISDRPFHAGYGNDSSEPNMGDYNQNVALLGKLHSVWGGTSVQPLFNECQGTSVMCTPDTYYDQRLATDEIVQLRALNESFVEAGAGCVVNGNLDPRERGNFTVPLKNYVTNPNTSPETITGISATLSTTTAGVTIVDGTSNYPNIAPGETKNNTDPFVVQLSSSFVPGTFIEFVLTVTSDQGHTQQQFRTETGSMGTMTTLINENFDGATAPNLPAGWTSAVGACAAMCDPWITSTARTTSQAAFHANLGAQAEWIRLRSPAVTIPTPASPSTQAYVTVDFDTNYSLEKTPTKLFEAFDGTFLRITDLNTVDPMNEVLRSIGAEAFASKITTAGIDHYPAHLVRSNDPLYFADQAVWSGNSIDLDDNADGTIHVSMKFPAEGMIGRGVQLRFEYTEDSNSNCLSSGGNGVCGIAIDNVVMKFVEVANGGPSAVADLSITKTDDPDPVVVGGEVTYHLTVKNNGDDPATNVVVVDTLPASSTFVSAMPSQGMCSYASGKVTCNLGTIGDGNTETIDIVAKLNGNPGPVTNKASVSSDVCEVDLTNNTAFVITTTVGLRKLSFSPTTVTGGCQNSTGTLLLTGPAPAGGLTVMLHSNSAKVHVPPTVVVPAGMTSTTFTADTDVVLNDTVVIVTATAGSSHVGGRLKVLAVRIINMTFNPNPVHGGQDSIATITLSCAPDEPITVRLTSDKSAARPVSPIVIPAGQSSGQATIHTLPVDSTRTAIITAAANGAYIRRNLTIIP